MWVRGALPVPGARGWPQGSPAAGKTWPVCAGAAPPIVDRATLKRLRRDRCGRLRPREQAAVTSRSRPSSHPVDTEARRHRNPRFSREPPSRAGGLSYCRASAVPGGEPPLCSRPGCPSDSAGTFASGAKPQNAPRVSCPPLRWAPSPQEPKRPFSEDAGHHPVGCETPPSASPDVLPDLPSEALRLEEKSVPVSHASLRSQRLQTPAKPQFWPVLPPRTARRRGQLSRGALAAGGSRQVFARTQAPDARGERDSCPRRTNEPHQTAAAERSIRKAALWAWSNRRSRSWKENPAADSKRDKNLI